MPILVLILLLLASPVWAQVGVCGPPGICLPALTPTATATATPEPSGPGCAYSFTDNTGALGATCLFTGTYDSTSVCTNPTLPTDVTFAGDGQMVTIKFGTLPPIAWVGRVTSARTASLTSLRIGTLRAVPVDGTVALLNDLHSHAFTRIRVSVGAAVPLTLCAYGRGCTADEACRLTGYLGTYIQSVDATHPPPTRLPLPVVHPGAP